MSVELVFLGGKPPAWQADAACQAMPTEDFFPQHLKTMWAVLV
ncbi:MAG: hypothetical protein ACRDYA_05825 [Egibacteraceae bacterium]